SGIDGKQVTVRQRQGRRDQQRIAVGRRARDAGGADISSRAGNVVDDHRFAPPPAELIRDQPPEDIGGRAGRGWNHDLYRARWKGLLRLAWQRPKRRARNGRGGEPSSEAKHASPPRLISATAKPAGSTSYAAAVHVQR